MGNIMTSMWNVHSGMAISQSALNTTAHNLANIDTEGYTRQQLIISDFAYKNIGYVNNKNMQVGLGAQIDSLRQLRNEFYDSMFRDENARLGYYDAQYSIASDLEGLFGEMEGKTFQQTIEDIWGTMEELAKEPEILATKSNFVNSILSFITRSKDIQKQIESYQIGLNDSLVKTVNEINELGQKIYDINKKIYTIEAAGIENANDYRDERNLLLDKLGYYTNIDVFEDPSGYLQVNVEGQTFITDMSVNKLKLVDASDESVLLKPIWEKTGDDLYSEKSFYKITDNTAVGYLKGIMVARGMYKADYTDMPIKPSDDASIEEKRQYEIDVANYNKTIDTSVIMSVQTQFDNLIHGIVTALNDIFCPNVEYDLKKAVEIDGYEMYIDGNKVTDLSKYIDEEGNILVFDSENAPVGDDKESTQGEELISRNISRYKEIQLVKDGEIITKKMYIKENSSDKKTLYTAANLDVNREIKNNYSKLPLNNIKRPGEYDYNGAVINIIDLWNRDFMPLDPNSLTMCNFKEYYNAFIFDLAGVTQMFDDISQGQAEAMQKLDDNRQNFMGVISDEELANLIKYQQAFNAAAKYYTTIDDMLGYLIEKLG